MAHTLERLVERGNRKREGCELQAVFISPRTGPVPVAPNKRPPLVGCFTVLWRAQFELRNAGRIDSRRPHGEINEAEQGLTESILCMLPQLLEPLEGCAEPALLVLRGCGAGQQGGGCPSIYRTA